MDKIDLVRRLGDHRLRLYAPSTTDCRASNLIDAGWRARRGWSIRLAAQRVSTRLRASVRCAGADAGTARPPALSSGFKPPRCSPCPSCACWRRSCSCAGRCRTEELELPHQGRARVRGRQRHVVFAPAPAQELLELPHHHHARPTAPPPCIKI